MSDHKRDLAMAYSVKRKAKKKMMADGGMALKDSSAKSESRPMPSEVDHDSAEVRQNSSKKAAMNDKATDQPTVMQARKPSITRLSQPKMVGSDAFSVRRRDDVEDAKDFMDSIPPQSPKAQPQARDNEEEAMKSGPSVKMSPIHSKNLNKYAEGGTVDPKFNDYLKHTEARDNAMDAGDSAGSGLDSIRHKHDTLEQARSAHARANPEAAKHYAEADKHHANAEKEYKKVKKMAKGGEINEDVSMDDAEMDNDVHPAGLEEDDDMMAPSEDVVMADHFAKGGMAEEEEEEHHDSIAAAIMAKRDRLHDMIDSGAMDEDHAAESMMADGGEILSHDSIYSDDSDQADLSRNADEDANEEDQTSFNALRKENYSESAGLRQLNNPKDSAQRGDSEEDEDSDKHDMVSSIRSKMNMKRQFKAR